MSERSLYEAVKLNCEISDARDCGIYSICTLVLKLRNLYKWENGLNPWEEPDSPVLLDWIAAKEEYWETLQEKPFVNIPVNGEEVDPFMLPVINGYLSSNSHLYGAGYGRSLKAVFFISEVLEERTVEGCPTYILGRDKVRELSSPFAMLQEGNIFIRKEPLRFYFWDQIQEINPSCKVSMLQALSSYGLVRDGRFSERGKLIETFDTIIDNELDIFIHHEVGESRENPLDGAVLRKVIAAFPASAIELVGRGVKDILADTHPEGLLGHIVAREKRSSLGFYVSFLDGMRKVLCPEIVEASKEFWKTGDWSLIENARIVSRTNNERIASQLREMSQKLDEEPPEDVRKWAAVNILQPLGLDVPEGN